MSAYSLTSLPGTAGLPSILVIRQIRGQVGRNSSNTVIVRPLGTKAIGLSLFFHSIKLLRHGPWYSVPSRAKRPPGRVANFPPQMCGSR